MDLPIPGSPLKRIILPGTIPSPMTLSNSSISLKSRIVLVCPLNSKEVGDLAPAFADLGVLEMLPFSGLPTFITSSAKLFQVLHSGHWPIHFELSYWQELQM